MNYVLGLDIGIASVGWAVIDLETLQVIESCSNIFTAAEAENNKDNIVNNKVLYNNKNMYVGNMLERYVEQAAAYISGKNIEIEFPNVENYEIEGGYEV